MNYKQYIDQMKKLHQEFLSFIDSEEDEARQFKKLCQLIEDQNIKNNSHDLKLFLYLIVRISNDHHRTPTFFEKIEQVINFLKAEITNFFTKEEIFDIFRDNQRVLLFLIEENILQLDTNISFSLSLLSNNAYFRPEIDLFSQNTFHAKLNMPLEIFNENRKAGENDSQICKLIRNDSIVDFIIFINQNTIQLSSRIEKSIFETNSFLIENQPTLIEYSAFFGSIQIFKYLMENNIELKPSIWQYAIHGKNPEIIQILEDNNILSENKCFEWFTESIKCHHNEIAIYIKDNYLTDKNSNSEGINSKYVQFYNFEFFQDDVIQSTFCDLYLKNYHNLVYLLNKDIKIDVNQLHSVHF